jgi:hypothetical protein
VLGLDFRTYFSLSDFWTFSKISFSNFLIFPYGLVMVFNIGREIVGSVVFGNKVEIRNRSRIEGGKNGLFSRVTDRCGRKPALEISIIRSGSQQIFFGQIPVKILNSIDHGGVALKRDLLFQAIVEYG